MLKPGRYIHYRGGIYVVLFIAKSDHSGEPMVVYMNETHGTYYVRNLGEFTENVVDSKDGTLVPRFKPLDDK